MLRIYNTLSKKVERFEPRRRGEVRLYTCGPTVYSRPHIGNFRTYLFEDTVKRHLVRSGLRVKHVMNITDVDETVMKETHKAGTARAKLARKNETLFMRDFSRLGGIAADSYPHVSRHIESMVKTAMRLEKKGAAFEDSRGRVFFDISRYKTYGKLVGRKIASGRLVAREDYKPYQAGDFLLVSKCRKQDCEKCFETSHGMCMPAWNVQCATMAMEEFGGPVDLAMGGYDNIFNHHENTRAIASCLLGREYSKYYMHVRHLVINGKKMSKSKGNFVTLPDMEKRGYSPRVVRMMLLSMHYRKRMDFTWDYAREIAFWYRRLEKSVRAIRGKNEPACPDFDRLRADVSQSFGSALDNDFDIPRALAIAEWFAGICAKHSISRAQSKQALLLLRDFDSVLGCLPIE